MPLDALPFSSEVALLAAVRSLESALQNGGGGGGGGGGVEPPPPSAHVTLELCAGDEQKLVLEMKSSILTRPGGQRLVILTGHLAPPDYPDPDLPPRILLDDSTLSAMRADLADEPMDELYRQLGDCGSERGSEVSSITDYGSGDENEVESKRSSGRRQRQAVTTMGPRRRLQTGDEHAWSSSTPSLSYLSDDYGNAENNGSSDPSKASMESITTSELVSRHTRGRRHFWRWLKGRIKIWAMVVFTQMLQYVRARRTLSTLRNEEWLTDEVLSYLERPHLTEGEKKKLRLRGGLRRGRMHALSPN